MIGNYSKQQTIW